MNYSRKISIFDHPKLTGQSICDHYQFVYKKIYEDDFVLSFYDINPQKKVHALVIPKGKYINLDDFNKNASKDEIIGLIKGISTVADKLGISSEKGNGYRTLANISEDGGQEVPHLHFHLFGGEKVGKMVSW